MIFFTDITTNTSNYCLLNVKRLHDPRVVNKKMLMIDPGVYELKKATEYSCIDTLHELASNHDLGPGKFISIDYPCDMNEEHSDLFIRKSVENNIKYAKNMWYICTVQSYFKDFDSFKEEWYKLEDIWLHCPKIIGLGNICRIMRPTEYTDKVFDLILKRFSSPRWIHIYGMALRLIKKYVPVLEKHGIKVSVDSTKWTYASNSKLKKELGWYCRKDTRDYFFNSYINTIRNAGVRVIT